MIVLLKSIAPLLLLAAHSVSALDPTRQPWHYGRSHWEDRDGLPQNTVQAIAQTREGYLWLGTEAGLVRFNGRQFQSYGTETEPAFRSNSVTSLAARPDGGLWIGTRAGLVLLRDGAFRRWGTEQGLRSETVRALALGADGLWVGTNGGVSLLKGDRISRWWTTADGLAGNAIRSLAEDEKGWWAGSAAGLSRFVDGKPQEAARRDLPSDTVRAVLIDRRKRVWVGFEAEGLHVIEAGKRRRFGPADGLDSNSIRTLLEDRDGNVWIGTVGAGLYRWRDGRFQRFSRREGLRSDHVRALFEDREGSIWVGMEAGGLTQLRDGRAVTYSPNDGLDTDFVRAVHTNAQGELWVGTEGGGLFGRTGDRFQAARTDVPPGGFVTALLTARDGSRWIGTEGQGAVQITGGRRSAHATNQGVGENSVWALAESADGAVWLGSSNGLIRKHRGEERVWRSNDGLRNNSIRSLHSARDGTMWIGLRAAGLQRLRAGRIESVALPAEAAITSFLEESDGSLWMSSSRGVLYWDGERVHRAARGEGLPSDSLFQVLPDDSGRLWFSSVSGIFALDREALREVFSGRRSRVEAERLTTADGMLSSECAGDAQPAGARTADGSLWFATIRGLVRIPPSGQKRGSRAAPTVVVERVALNGQAMSPAAALRSPAGNRLFSVDFAALSFVAPEAIRYRYRLAGRDTEWTEANGETEAVYHAVPAGDYRFEVQAAHASGEWSRAATLSLAVAPYFYQTPWFYAALAAAIAALAYLGHWQHTRTLRREFAAVLGERTRIAREIHDTLLQGFAGATLQLGAIARRLRRDPDQAGRDLENVLDQIDGCLAEARQEIGELRAAPEAAPLEERLREAARTAAAGSGLETVVTVTGAIRRLDGELEKNLLRIVRESTANAARHARAGRIDLELLYEAESVRLVARDDGTGLAPPDASREHFGILGMRERTEQLGGSFALRSVARQGTEVEVTLPVRSR